MEEKQETIITSIRIEKELHRRIRIYAIENDLTFSAVIHSAFTKFLEESEAK